jgi:glycerol-3-phosphate acyltransferase PlsY
MVCAVLAVLLLWRHSGNIRKLLDGTESRIGQKAASNDQP